MIYLDHNATTPVDPRVFDAMKPYFCDLYGNAASRHHSAGWTAEKAVEKARLQVATLIGAGRSDTTYYPIGRVGLGPPSSPPSLSERIPFQPSSTGSPLLPSPSGRGQGEGSSPQPTAAASPTRPANPPPDPREIIFTSGATESNNLALKGVAEAHKNKGRHIITQVTEHKAILDPCKRLQQQGCDITFLPVNPAGQINLDQLAAAIRPDTVLVSIMYANNETGVLQPIRQIGALCKQRGVLFHADATQAVGHIPVDVQADGIDLLSLSAHKLYGPKGIGALYIRRENPRVKLIAQMDGGGHERGFRSGTLNVPGIVGLGAACELAGELLPTEAPRLAALRDRLESELLNKLPYTTLNGDRTHRLPHTTNLSFAYVEGESLMLAIPDIAVSSGSACTSATLQPSYVLQAMSVSDELAHCSLRFGLGQSTTAQQIDYVVENIIKAVNRLRELSPLYEMAMEGTDLSKIQWEAH